MDESRLDALADRLRALERENGRLKWAGAASLAVVLTLVALGAVRGEARQARVEKVIRAENFIAVDEQGRGLIGIGTGLGQKGGPAIEFLDRSGKRRMALGLGEGEAPYVLLTGRDGRDELAIEVRPGLGMGVSFRDRKRDSGLVIGTGPDGVAALGIMGEGGKSILELGANPDGISRLILRDKDGKETARVPAR